MPLLRVQFRHQSAFSAARTFFAACPDHGSAAPTYARSAGTPEESRAGSESPSLARVVKPIQPDSGEISFSQRQKWRGEYAHHNWKFLRANWSTAGSIGKL